MSTRHYLALSAAVFAALPSASAQTTPPKTKDRTYIGINNGTGYDTTPAYVDTSIRHDNMLGAGIVRMGMDGVGGQTAGAEFTYAERDVVVDKYLKAKIEIHSVLPNRSDEMRDGNWHQNWTYFVRGVMTHYKGKIKYYIIGNEPDLDDGNGGISAQDAFELTKIAYTLAKSIDPEIKIESPPLASTESPMLRQLLALGIDKYSDFIGLHAYGGQIAESRFASPWKALAEFNVKKPIAISEAGTVESWCQTGGDSSDCRRRWFALFAQRLKRFGYHHALLFDLDKHEEWAIAPDFKPSETFTEITKWQLNRPVMNGDFEGENDPEHDWVPFIEEDVGEAPGVRFVTNDSKSAHGGKGYVMLASSLLDPAAKGNVRRIIGQLPKGKTVKISAWAYAKGTAKPVLRGLGYDVNDGDAEKKAVGTKVGAWEQLSISVPVSAYWTVVELGREGGATGSFVLWDDVTVEGQTGDTTAGAYDLYVAKAGMSPSSRVAAGTNVTFRALVANKGSDPTPEGIEQRVAFYVDDKLVSWTRGSTKSLLPKKGRIMNAAGGPDGDRFWKATSGRHKLTVVVDYQNRLAGELNEGNNSRSAMFEVP